MPNKALSLITFLIFATLLGLASCGGGGGQGVATSAVVKINLNGVLPAGSTLGGAQFTLILPAGVAPTTQAGTTDASGAVTPAGPFAGGAAAASYTAATTTTPGSMKIAVITTASVTQVGGVATVVLNLASGATPTVSDFSLSGVQVFDSAGTALPGITAVVASVTLQ
jgi:hypothetical protein